MSRSLRIALDRNGLEIYYQPIFEKYGNQLIGFEAPIARGQFGRRFLFQPISCAGCRSLARVAGRRRRIPTLLMQEKVDTGGVDFR